MPPQPIKEETSSDPVARGEKRCGDVLLGALNNHRGLVAAELDVASRSLMLKYDPRKVSRKTMVALAARLARQLGEGIQECDGSFSPASCARCVEAAGMGAQDPGENRTRLRLEGSRLILEHGDPSEGSDSVVQPLSLLPAEEAALVSFWSQNCKVILTTLCASSLLLGTTLQGAGDVPHWVSILAYVVSCVSGGWFAARAAFLELIEGTVNVDLLMVTAATGAAVLGRWQEGAVLMFLFSLSGTLESYAMRRTRQAIRALMKMRPREALVRRDGMELKVLVEDLKLGDTVVVKPGEAISADGQVVLGQSFVNQSAITGESVPVRKIAGDVVFAGTLNEKGSLEVRVTKPFADTTINKIIELVEEAQSQKALPQRFSDWFGRYYTLAVLVGSGLYMAVLLALGTEWQKTFYQSMVVLVAASPCALVMATPSAILSAIANAARRGILMKGGAALETLGRVRVMAIDKTGTLTSGRAQVTDVFPAAGVSEDELLRLAASAESLANHPLADAVTAEARRRALRWDEPTSLEAISGRGVRARVHGRDVWVGNELLLREAGLEISGEWKEKLQRLKAQGKTFMLVGEKRVLGLLGVADTLRPTARATVRTLKALGIRTVMLTGDNSQVARATSEELEMDECRADLLPDEKLSIVRELRQEYGDIGMVGDGVNDAPALASATVGVAMGAAGTDVALETADIVLMSDDLSKLVEAVDLGRETVKVLKQNWYFALGVVLFLVVAALSGSIPLPLAVVGHEGNTLVVVLSGLRLLVYEPKSKEERRVGRRDDTKMGINGWWRRSDKGSRTVS